MCPGLRHLLCSDSECRLLQPLERQVCVQVQSVLDLPAFEFQDHDFAVQYSNGQVRKVLYIALWLLLRHQVFLQQLPVELPLQRRQKGRLDLHDIASRVQNLCEACRNKANLHL